MSLFRLVQGVRIVDLGIPPHGAGCPNFADHLIEFTDLTVSDRPLEEVFGVGGLFQRDRWSDDCAHFVEVRLDVRPLREAEGNMGDVPAIDPGKVFCGIAWEADEVPRGGVEDCLVFWGCLGSSEIRDKLGMGQDAVLIDGPRPFEKPRRACPGDADIACGDSDFRELPKIRFHIMAGEEVEIGMPASYGRT